MENVLTEKELKILKDILIYLKKIENENSILRGNLLSDEEKQFIFND